MKLSERVRNGEFQLILMGEGIGWITNTEAEDDIADEIAKLEAQRDALLDALEGLMMLESRGRIMPIGGLYMHREGHDLYNQGIDDAAHLLKDSLGTNPLAEAQAKKDND